MILAAACLVTVLGVSNTDTTAAVQVKNPNPVAFVVTEVEVGFIDTKDPRYKEYQNDQSPDIPTVYRPYTVNVVLPPGEITPVPFPFPGDTGNINGDAKVTCHPEEPS